MNIHNQSGILPVRMREGNPEILLITSMGGKRWVIPKGIIEEGMTPVQSAVKEAWEEAGIRGTTFPETIGTYTYFKWGGDCTVQVFRMSVEEEADHWPESEARKRCWFSPEEAVRKVKDGGLKKLIQSLTDTEGLP